MDGEILYPLAVRDLTGYVLRTEQYPFAQGGNSDIWKCQLVDGSTTIKVRALVNCPIFLASKSAILQVVAKVIKGIQDVSTLKVWHTSRFFQSPQLMPGSFPLATPPRNSCFGQCKSPKYIVSTWDLLRLRQDRQALSYFRVSPTWRNF